MKIKKKEILIYISLTLYAVANFFIRTSFYSDSNSQLFKFMTIISVALMLSNVLFEKSFNIKKILGFLFLAVLFWIDSIPSGWHDFFYIFIIIWGCRNCDFKKIIKYLITLIGVLVIIMFGAYVLGIANNDVHIQGSRIRSSLGYTSWTILPFQLFSLSVFYFYVNDKRFFIDRILIYAVNYFVYLQTDVKTTLPLLIICDILMALGRKKNFHWNKLKKFVFIPELAALISYIVFAVYLKFDSVKPILNVVFNYRLYNVARAIAAYDVTWLSNPYAEWFASETEYLIVDNSYYYILLTWGILGLILVLGIYSYIIWYSIKIRDNKLFLITLVYVFISLFWSRMFVLSEALMLIVFSRAFSNKRFYMLSPSRIEINKKME